MYGNFVGYVKQETDEIFIICINVIDLLGSRAQRLFESSVGKVNVGIAV